MKFILPAVLILVACDPAAPSDAGIDSGLDDAGIATQCARDSDCADARYCFESSCRPGDSNADASGCVSEPRSCEPNSTCDEAAAACVPNDCLEADADGDGHEAVACGGDDCDDSDAARYPGNPEVCDAAGHDEDCDDTTLGATDADGDGEVSNGCCFGATCGPDCDDGNRAVNSGAPEECNGRDDDCDGTTDGLDAFCPFGACVDSRCRASAWARAFGSDTGDEQVVSVQTDSNGDIYLLLVTNSDASFQLGPDVITAGAWAISYSSSGAYRWALKLGETGSLLERVAALDSSLLVIGNRVFALRNTFAPPTSLGLNLEELDPATGTLIAAQPIAGPAGAAAFLARVGLPTEDGILVVGVAALATGEEALWMAHLRLDGSKVAERFSETDSMFVPTQNGGRTATRSVDGVVHVLVRATTSLDADGVSVPEGFVVLEFTSGLQVASAGSALPTPPGLAYLGFSLAPDALLAVGTYDTGLSIGGETWPTPPYSQGFVISFDRGGETIRWSRNDARYQFVEVGTDGAVTVGGYFIETLNLGLGNWGASGPCFGGLASDGFFARLDAGTGVALEGRSFPGTECESVTATATDRFGATVLTGTFSDRITLGGSTFVAGDGDDAFVVRVAD